MRKQTGKEEVYSVKESEGRSPPITWKLQQELKLSKTKHSYQDYPGAYMYFWWRKMRVLFGRIH